MNAICVVFVIRATVPKPPLSFVSFLFIGGGAVVAAVFISVFHCLFRYRGSVEFLSSE